MPSKDRRLLAQAFFAAPDDEASVQMPSLPMSPVAQTPSVPAFTAHSPEIAAYRQGLVALNNYDYPAASQAFKKTLEIDPNSFEARVSLDHILRIMSENTRLGRKTYGPDRGFR